ncbi:Cobalamin biosynthesis protein CbiB [Gloeomargarita lithophora Alchichica-D10]|uniref:Cobalamin biosynthesis protein CobD n=1 Tax=Gloeomargarita lithophora Alchichica-D10 TaxID=1188229 RepID=A0A1J0A978_9CYAN|nr:adenosylcobinamide-phosphate synthase CbiB [Gloeomargarita lithophora]APB32471.1 Cobalamin biosynthesis protein CbiB [Gloeomargarita lithophora Alchichica-D10]
MLLTQEFLTLILGQHIALVIFGAAILDYLIGDPPQWLHPVQVMGWGISNYCRWIWARNLGTRGEKIAGIALVLITLSITCTTVWGLIFLTRLWHFQLAIVVQMGMLASCLAGRSLHRAAMEVLVPLEVGNLPTARQVLSQYVGRDTEHLETEEILRAVLETVSENATDGVMAPLFYALLGGMVGQSPAVWAFGYKAVSTLDSMVGYRTPRYAHLGWASAHLDDVLTWLPCRLVVFTIGLLSGKPLYVWRICRRDAPFDSSPNSGWSECCYAAALGVQLGGLNIYRGVAKMKPKLGESHREITPSVIQRALNLTRAGFLLWLLLGLLLLGILPG